MSDNDITTGLAALRIIALFLALIVAAVGIIAFIIHHFW